MLIVTMNSSDLCASVDLRPADNNRDGIIVSSIDPHYWVLRANLDCAGQFIMIRADQGRCIELHYIDEYIDRLPFAMHRPPSLHSHYISNYITAIVYGLLSLCKSIDQIISGICP